MITAHETIEKTKKFLTELLWWNRGLTKLDNDELFSNWKEFLSNELIEDSGTLLEYIKPPLMDDLKFIDRANSLGLEKETIVAIQQSFGKKDFSLYAHQKETIISMINKDNDIVLSVPTATGKTESFFIPVLDYCVKKRKIPGLKTIIIYPTKTLEIDQLNRFIEYLDKINIQLDDKEKITIGIWDGDTPQSVGDSNSNFSENSISPNSPLRGLICPKENCDKHLKVRRDGHLECENDGTVLFVHAIRDIIEKYKADILITNPEALDYLMCNPNTKKINILGGYKTKYPLKYVVYDEAHTWSGSQGSSICLLNKRLRDFYRLSKPKFVLLSATIKNPAYLGAKLLSKKEEQIEVIKYKPNKHNFHTSSSNPINFQKWKFCSFTDLWKMGIYLKFINEENDKELKSEFQNYPDILQNLVNLNLIQMDSEEIKLLDEYSNLIELLTEEIKGDPKKIWNLIRKDEILVKKLKKEDFVSKWVSIIDKNVPEIGYIIDLIDKYSLNMEISFIHLKRLTDKISQEFSITNKSEINKIIEVLLSFGRFANLLIDRYHIFLKPPNALYWCTKCFKLTKSQTCCNSETYELRFCRKCHHPYIGLPEQESEEIYSEIQKKIKNFHKKQETTIAYDEDEELEIDEVLERPEIMEKQENWDDIKNNEAIIIKDSTFRENNNNEEEEITKKLFFQPLNFDYVSMGNSCPNCHSFMRQMDLYTCGLYSSTLTNFLLSAVTRYNESGKIIVFSDSRGTAEKTGADFINFEYGMSTSRKIIDVILEHEKHKITYGRKNSDEFSNELESFLKSRYIEPITEILQDRDSMRIFSEYGKQNVFPLRYLSKHRVLIDNSILTTNELMDSALNPIEIILGQELLKLFLIESSGKFGFSMETFKFYYQKGFYGALKYDKLKEKLSKRLPFLNKMDFDKVLPNLIKIFSENGVIETVSSEELEKHLISEENRLSLEKSNSGALKYTKNQIGKRKEKLLKSFDNDLNKLNLNGLQLETPLFRKGEYKNLNIELTLVNKVFFCKNCYYIAPIGNNSINYCPKCNSKDFIIRNRFDFNPDLIYNPIKSGMGFDFDHWAYESLKFNHVEKSNYPYPVLGNHRAGFPAALRGAIEECFRKGEVNIISSTPTMELGVSIGKLNCAVQIGIPPTLANYIQRCGRTGRDLSTSSIIFTVIQPQNGIDSYYFNNIEEFLKNLTPITIPDYRDIECVFNAQIITFIFSYLARNPDNANIFESNFISHEEYNVAKNFAIDIAKRIKNILKLINDEKSVLKEEIQRCFGSIGVKQFDEIFESKKIFKVNFEKYFNMIRKLANGSSLQNYAERTRDILSITRNIDLFCIYRAFGENLMIQIFNRQNNPSIVLEKETSRAIRENYPGEKNQDGALFYVQAAKYIVRGVTCKNKIGETKTCYNEKIHPPISIKTDEDNCPLCGEPIYSTKIFNVTEIKAVPVKSRKYSFTTSPILIGNINPIEESVINTIKFRTCDINIKYGKYNCLQFVPKFYKRMSYNTKDPKILNSEAEIIESENEQDFTLDDLDTLEKSSGYAPIGMITAQNGIQISIELQNILDLLKSNHLVVQFIISLIQAMKRAISILTSANMDDFEIFYQLSDEIEISIVEKYGGNSGLLEILMIDLKKKTPEFFKHIKEICSCEICGDLGKYCNNCLLIDRTPSNYITNDYLNKNIVKRVLN